MGANDAAEMLEEAKAECVRLEAEVARLRGAAVTTDPTDEEWVCQNCQTTLDLSEYNAAMFAAGRESVAPRITREDVDRIVRETIAIVNGWPGHGGRFMTPDLTDAVLSALGMTEEGQ